MSGINEQVINAEIYQIGPQGIPGEAATISVGTVTTGEPGTDASVTNSGTSTAAILDFVIPQGEQGLQGIQGPQGIQGLTGATGNGISSIEKITTVGLTDTYRITFTNNTYYDFEVINGSSISDIEKTSTSGLVDTYTITLTNGNTHTFTVTNGAKGDKGETGEVGNGILGVNKMSTTGLVDNYRMTFTNGTYFDFDVTNAKSIVSISKISTSGLIDTYRITFNDNTNFQFPVSNGNGVAGVTLLSWKGLDKTYRMTFTNGSHFDFVVSNGAAGQAEWGGISGVLSNQHDLQDALDAKANVSQTHALKAYSDKGELLTDPEGLEDVKKYAHSSFDLSKFTVVGSPNITNDGIASGFSSSGSRLEKSIDFTNMNTFTIEGEFNHPVNLSNGGRSQIIFSLYDTTLGSSRLILNNLYSGAAALMWNYPASSNTMTGDDSWFAYTQNAMQSFKIDYDGTKIRFYLNGNLVKTSADVDKTWLQSNYTLLLGNSKLNNNYNLNWMGSIDLKQFSITIDGVEVFSGNKTGIDTIKPDDYAVVGTPVISADGVASGFSSGNYLQTIQCKDLNGKSWAFKCKFYWQPITTSTCLINLSGTWVAQGQIGLGNSNNGNRLEFIGRFGDENESTKEGLGLVIDNKFTYNGWYEVSIDFDINTGVYTLKLYDKDNNLLASNTYTPTSTNKQLYAIATNSTNYIRLGYGFVWTGSQPIDLNAFKVYVDGNLVYQPCLKIPYTESKTGSKIVNATYRDRVNDMASQFGSAPYYTLSDTDFTLPQVELYGLIGDKTLRDSYYNGATYWELYSNRRLEQGGSCESGVEYTFPKPFTDTNYILTIPYSSKTATSFIPSATGDFIAKGTGLL